MGDPRFYFLFIWSLFLTLRKIRLLPLSSKNLCKQKINKKINKNLCKKTFNYGFNLFIRYKTASIFLHCSDRIISCIFFLYLISWFHINFQTYLHKFLIFCYSILCRIRNNKQDILILATGNMCLLSFLISPFRKVAALEILVSSLTFLSSRTEVCGHLGSLVG